MIIEFPRGIRIDIDNIPDNFNEMIKKSFEEYTEGTREDYTYQDKLSYIDRCRELLHHSGNEEDCVFDLMKCMFEHEVNECGNIPDKEDYLTLDFMSDCYREGKTNLHAHYTGDHHKDDKIMKLLERVIKVVINY